MATPYSIINTSNFVETDSDATLNKLTFSDGSEFTTAKKIKDDTTFVSVDSTTPKVEFTLSDSLTAKFSTNRLEVPEIRAIGSDGLNLYNDGGSQGVKVKDNGDTDVTGYLDIYGNFKCAGYEAFTVTANTLFFKLGAHSGTSLKIRSNGGGYGNNNVTVNADNFDNTSDDRLKTEETLITNATETIKKLKPQLYKKYGTFDLSGDYHVESGLISQEVYHNIPELRHLVDTGNDASGNPVIISEMDLSNVNIDEDPNYEDYGWNDPAALNYIGLIPYLIKSNQELEARISAIENISI